MEANSKVGGEEIVLQKNKTKYIQWMWFYILDGHGKYKYNEIEPTCIGARLW